MEISSLNTLFYTLAFVVPGFIIHFTYSIFVPQKVEQIQFYFLRFLFFSAINYSIWSWLIYLIIQPDILEKYPRGTAASWWFIIFISPVLLGMLCGYLNKLELVRKALQKIGLNPIHVIPTGWDFKFSKIEDKTWVIITLKDGSTVAGLFGTKSFASSDPQERDIFVEEVFCINDEGKWESATRNNGILIRGEQIKYIEFFHN